MDHARFAPLSELEKLRGERDCSLSIDGIWYNGSLKALEKPCVAIVGTRAATAYGRRIAYSFARDLAAAGCCIVSGLALGIDASAHEGAVNAVMPTIGVLGSGLDRFFPRRNIDLAERMIAHGGAVISPFPADCIARPHQFLQRNGIVAALSDAVVVIEAPVRSGALNTAGWAAGRVPVLAVPGDIDRAHVAGCHALLRDGAILARSAADVLEALRISVAVPNTSGEVIESKGLGAQLLLALEDGEADIEMLNERVHADAPELLSALAMLELEGAVERTGTHFARIR